MTDLDELIDAVERGVATRDDFHASFKPESGTPSFRLHGEYMQGFICMLRAYHGSLDAAKALHEALLGGPIDGWMWNIVNDSATLWPGPPDGNPRDYVDTFSENNAARAWLLAILNACRSLQ